MIHSGLRFAEETFDTAPGIARRYVIDLSGNGRADDSKQLAEMRDRLISRGIVINGLAIEEDSDTLTQYFETYVIGGDQAFVETADEFIDFGTAMEIKLHREISGAIFSQPRDIRPATRLSHLQD